VSQIFGEIFLLYDVFISENPETVAVAKL